MEADQIVKHYQSWRLKLWVLSGILLLCILANVSLGSVTIPVSEIVSAITGQEIKSSWQEIIYNFRMPKAITAVLCGMALGVSGLFLQTFFRNPLAGPFILGISSGASLGVAVLIMAGVSFGFSQSIALTTIAAAIGAGGVMLLVLLVAMRLQDNMSLLIVGLMFGSATGALVSVLQFFSQAESIQAYISWTFGSLGSVTWSELGLFAPVIVVSLFIAVGLLKPLNAMLLGENYAQSMGLHVKSIRIIIVLLTSLLAGTVTAFCGPIAFIGVALPHLARIIFNTSDHFKLFPLVLLMGGILMLVCDSIAQLPGLDYTLPINAVTALVGAPIVIWVIIKKRQIKKAM